MGVSRTKAHGASTSDACIVRFMISSTTARRAVQGRRDCVSVIVGWNTPSNIVARQHLFLSHCHRVTSTLSVYSPTRAQCTPGKHIRGRTVPHSLLLRDRSLPFLSQSSILASSPHYVRDRGHFTSNANACRLSLGSQ